MNDLPPEAPPAVGVRRFHKTTMAATIGFLLLLALRYFRLYRLQAETRDALYGALALVVAVGVFIYLRRFGRSGGLG